MSMISELIENLKRYARFSKPTNPSWSNVMSQAADTIDALSAKLQVVNMDNVDGWISCEDGLPEVGQIVIVYQSFRGIHGNSETHTSIGQYLGNGNNLPHWRFISYMVNIYGELTYASIADNWQGDSEYVVSWRTLPEPYRNTPGEGDAYE